MLFGDRTGAGMQVARAGVVTEPGPELEHIVELGRRQILRASASAPGTAHNKEPPL